ncbi:hypothetical protein LSAT2_013118 [Lamellibrachia satsuma]|nr:hypothetical protein LSAT2_013118 [Lamellibrachia satsuma]
MKSITAAVLCCVLLTIALVVTQVAGDNGKVLERQKRHMRDWLCGCCHLKIPQPPCHKWKSWFPRLVPYCCTKFNPLLGLCVP